MERLSISIEKWSDITSPFISPEMADTVYKFTEGQTIRQIAGSDSNEQRRIYHIDRVARARIKSDLIDKASRIGLDSETEIGTGVCHSCANVVPRLKNEPREAKPVNMRLYGGFKICDTCHSELTGGSH